MLKYILNLLIFMDKTSQQFIDVLYWLYLLMLKTNVDKS